MAFRIVSEGRPAVPTSRFRVVSGGAFGLNKAETVGGSPASQARDLLEFGLPGVPQWIRDSLAGIGVSLGRMGPQAVRAVTSGLTLGHVRPFERVPPAP